VSVLAHPKRGFGSLIAALGKGFQGWDRAGGRLPLPGRASGQLARQAQCVPTAWDWGMRSAALKAVPKSPSKWAGRKAPLRYPPGRPKILWQLEFLNSPRISRPNTDFWKGRRPQALSRVPASLRPGDRGPTPTKREAEPASPDAPAAALRRQPLTGQYKRRCAGSP
jgi:hypothetical protein